MHHISYRDKAGVDVVLSIFTLSLKPYSASIDCDNNWNSHNLIGIFRLVKTHTKCNYACFCFVVTMICVNDMDRFCLQDADIGRVNGWAEFGIQTSKATMEVAGLLCSHSWVFNVRSIHRSWNWITTTDAYTLAWYIKLLESYTAECSWSDF